MKFTRNPLFFLSFLFLATFLFTGCTGRAAMPGGVDFNSLDVKDEKVVQAFASAKANDKSVLVIFDAAWCGVCRKFNGETMTDSRVRKTLAGYEILNVDVDKYPEPTKAFGKRRDFSRIESVPTVMIFSPEGLQTDEFVGFYNAKSFNKILKRNL